MDLSDLLKCPVCFEGFDCDVALFSTEEERRSSRLPILSAKCCHKICASCLNEMQVVAISDNSTKAKAPKWFKCHTCKEKTAFNAVDMKVDLYACGAVASLKKDYETTKRSSSDAIHPKDVKQRKVAAATIPSKDDASPSPSIQVESDSNNEPVAARRVEQRNVSPAAPSTVGRDCKLVGTDSAEGAEGAFTEHSFMKNKIFLLNSFIDAKSEINQGFGPFIRESIAIPGFRPVGPAVAEMIPSASYEEIRDEILRNPDVKTMNDARQIALWLKEATVGSFVILRHEHNKCPFLPAKLKDDQGHYIGKVYAIGVITEVVKPCSKEEKRISTELVPDLNAVFYTHSFCLVSWKKMGFKESLQQSSLNYINVVCQPTLAQILKPGKKYSRSTTSENIRRDLWKNATVPICSSDFPEVYDGETRRRIMREKNSEHYGSFQ